MLPDIKQRKQEIAAKKEQIRQSQSRINALINHGQYYARNLWSHYEPAFLDSQRTLLDRLASQPLEVWAGWNEPTWAGWKPGSMNLGSFIRVGEEVESYPEIEQHSEILCKLPVLLPFVGSEKTFIIHSRDGDASGLELLQSLVFRTAVLLPLQARYTLIDPAGAGRAFPMRRALLSLKENGVRENTGNLYRDLKKIHLDIQRIIETYIDLETPSFETLPEDIQANENFEFIFAANFPIGYEQREIENLYRIANSGSPAGKYVFIHCNDDHELSEDMSTGAIKKAIHLCPQMSIPKFLNLKLNYDVAPSLSLQTELFNKLTKLS